jgi:hypothetical protein
MSDEDSAAPPSSAQYHRRRGGWQGDDLELDRKDPTDVAPHAAVDLSQFRNTEVGKGYQAKHVIRQRSAAAKETIMAVRDMTKVDTTVKKSKEAKVKKRKSFRNDTSQQQQQQQQLQRYFQCQGLRTFRKELAAIEAPAQDSK